ETKPVQGLTTEYYVDKAGRIMKVLHLQDGVEIAGFEYTRDAKDRITDVAEYQNGELHATTTYTYGCGNLAVGDIDPTEGTVDRSRFYGHGLLNYSPGGVPAGAPNRLVCEQRTGDALAYKKEYWYDPGGNRLAMRESAPDGLGGWTVQQITRYNYLSHI